MASLRDHWRAAAARGEAEEGIAERGERPGSMLVVAMGPAALLPLRSSRGIMPVLAGSCRATAAAQASAMVLLVA